MLPTPRKAEERMSRIAGEFCTWLRDLPGEDTKVTLYPRLDCKPLQVNQMGEEHLRSLFDTAQSANPGTTKLAEGLRSWAKFGSNMAAVADTSKFSMADQVKETEKIKPQTHKSLNLLDIYDF